MEGWNIEFANGTKAVANGITLIRGYVLIRGHSLAKYQSVFGWGDARYAEEEYYSTQDQNVRLATETVLTIQNMV